MYPLLTIPELTNVEHLQPSHWNAPAKRSIDETSMNSYHFPSERKRRGWNNWTIGNASTLVSDRFLATRRGILIDASPCQKDACLQCLTMESTLNSDRHDTAIILNWTLFPFCVLSWQPVLIGSPWFHEPIYQATGDELTRCTV